MLPCFCIRTVAWNSDVLNSAQDLQIHNSGPELLFNVLQISLFHVLLTFILQKNGKRTANCISLHVAISHNSKDIALW